MQQFANIDFLDQIEGYDEGDIEAEFNCLVMSDKKLAMSFDMYAWDDDNEEYHKGRITFFWNLDTTNPKAKCMHLVWQKKEGSFLGGVGKAN